MPQPDGCSRGKNAIITQALKEYLDKISQERFLEEARSQSLIASSARSQDADDWLDHADTRAWQ